MSIIKIKKYEQKNYIEKKNQEERKETVFAFQKKFK